MEIDQNDLDQLTQMFQDESPKNENLNETNADLLSEANGNKSTVDYTDRQKQKTAVKAKGRTSKKRKSNLISEILNANNSAMEVDGTSVQMQTNDLVTEDIVEDAKAKPSKVNKKAKKTKDSTFPANIEETEKKRGKKKEKNNDIAEKTEIKAKEKEREKEKEKEKENEKEKNSQDASKLKTDNTHMNVEAIDKKKKKKEKNEEKADKAEKTDKVSKIKKKEKDSEVSVKKSELEDGDPRKTVLDYMITQNRPYSLINIFDNLHATIKKGHLQKILDSLSDSGDLICKEYSSKIYLASQKYYPPVDEKLMIKLDENIEESRNTLNSLKEINTSLQNEHKSVLTKYTDDELKSQLEQKKIILADSQSVLTKWEMGKIEKIPEEKMAEAERNYNLNKITYRKTKKICIDIIDVICENTEMKRVDFMNMVGLENDSDIVLILPN